MEYTTSDICNQFKINKTTLDYWRNTKKVPSIKRGRCFYFNLNDIEEFINKSVKNSKLDGMYCEECKTTTKYKSWRSFVRDHLIVEHNMDAKEYYDKFILEKNDQKFCITCNKEKSFLSISKGYAKECSCVKCRSNNIEIKAKIEDTKFRRYGDRHFTNKEKAKQTSLEKYGVEHFTNREKAKQTSLEKYGTLNMFEVDSLNEKRKNTCLEKYGKEYFTNGEEISKSKTKKYYEKIKNYLLNDNKELIGYDGGNIKIHCKKCNSTSDMSTKFAYSRYTTNIDLCLTCNPITSSTSFAENEIKQFLSEINIDFEPNNRQILGGRELDIYCQSHNIAIEFNGCFWHSSLFKTSKYHINKLEMCESKNIRLFQIFEDQWLHKKDIIKSMIINMFNKTTNNIYARKCIIKDVPEEDKNIFLNTNHLQGECLSTINYGLYHNDELVSLMCFNKPRYKKYGWELVRFCNKLNSRVTGASSKLFKHFTKNICNKNIVSYCDRLWSVGNMYEKIGFNLSHISSPSYFYVNRKELVRYHRFHFNKKKMNIPDYITEEEYMDKLGYLKIYNCGYKVYKWNGE
jgi:hypothetical protein